MKADPPLKRYDVRNLVLLGCSHEAPDGLPFDAHQAFDAGWKIFSVHGTEDEEAQIVSAQVFHSAQRAAGHRLRLVAGADHDFDGHVPLVSNVINDWLEGARRLTANDNAAGLHGTKRILLATARRAEQSVGDETHGDGVEADGEDDEEPEGSGEAGVPSHVSLSGTRPGSRMLGSSGMVWLVEELKTDTSVLSLDLSCNNIRVSGGTALAGALESNTTLTSLDLHSNALLSSARAFATMLLRNQSLTHLNLRTNGIGANGAAALAKALGTDQCRLTSLNLRDNSIMAVGAAALAVALKANPVLKDLDLSENLIKEAGAATLAEALGSNGSLTALNLRYNGLRSGALQVAKMLMINTSLRSLNLAQNDIDGKGVRAVAKALSENINLTSLDLDFEPPSPNDFKHCADSTAKIRAQELTASLAEALKTIEGTLKSNAEEAAAAASRAAIVEDELRGWPSDVAGCTRDGDGSNLSIADSNCLACADS